MESPDRPAGLGRLVAFYVILIAVVVAVIAVVINDGSSKKAQPSIAGGYLTTAANPCLGKVAAAIPGAPLPVTAPAQSTAVGPSFNIAQSAQFVTISNAAGTLGGQLRLHPGAVAGGHPLTGTVNCVSGGKQLALQAVAVPGVKGFIAGTLGGVTFTANLKSDPPPPGAAAPRVPVLINGIYAASPRSTCLGGTFQLNGTGPVYTLVDNGLKLGAVQFYSKTGVVAGDISCAKGGKVRLRGTANDRVLNNVTLIPLDVAKPVKLVQTPALLPSGAVGVVSKPILTTASGLPPSGETFTATKTRTAASKLVAAFLLAAAIVVVVAYLFGVLAVRHVQVEQQDRRRVLGEALVHLVEVARLGDDAEVGLRLEEHLQAGPHDGVVIADDDREGRGAAHWGNLLGGGGGWEPEVARSADGGLRRRDGRRRSRRAMFARCSSTMSEYRAHIATAAAERARRRSIARVALSRAARD